MRLSSGDVIHVRLFYFLFPLKLMSCRTMRKWWVWLNSGSSHLLPNATRQPARMLASVRLGTHTHTELTLYTYRKVRWEGACLEVDNRFSNPSLTGW